MSTIFAFRKPTSLKKRYEFSGSSIRASFGTVSSCGTVIPISQRLSGRVIMVETDH